MSYPTLTNEFVEFRQGRSIEPRYVVVQATTDSNSPSYLTASADVRATYFAKGNTVLTEIAASGALPVKTAVDILDSSGGALAMTLASPVVANETLINGLTKTIVLTTAGNAVTITPVAGDAATLPGINSGENVSYVWDSTRWTLTATGNTVVSPLLIPDGTAAAPGLAYAADVDVGLFRPAANNFGIATAGVESCRFDATQHMLANPVNSAVGTPLYSFIGDTNTGMYQIAADSLGFAAGGVLALDCTEAGGVADVTVSNGDLYVNRPAGTEANLYVRSGDSSTARAINWGISAGNGWAMLQPSGQESMVLYSLGTAANTDFMIETGTTGNTTMHNQLVNLPQAVTTLTDADDVLTIAQMLQGYFDSATLAAGRNATSPTAALIVAGISNCTIGTTFDFTINNTQAGAFARTLVAGANCTVQGTAAVAQNDIGLFRVVVEAIAGAGLVTIIRLD